MREGILWSNRQVIPRYPHPLSFWQERIPYDEIRYLKSLQKSRSPLLTYLAQPAPETT